MSRNNDVFQVLVPTVAPVLTISKTLDALLEGELGVYVVSDGKKSPYRMKFRSPGFSNLSLLNHIAVGGKIGDLVASMATLDIVVPDIDR